jgi:hypothetical protein
LGCRIDGAGKEESDEREIVSLPVVFIIASTIPVRYRALVLLATFASLRWGELAALRRENIDLDNILAGTILVVMATNSNGPPPLQAVVQTALRVATTPPVASRTHLSARCAGSRPSHR